MPRPKTKADLLSLSATHYKELLAYIQGLDPKERSQAFPSGTLNRNIRDVLGHLHHWHGLVVSWCSTGAQGGTPQMPAPGYTWRTVPDLNKKIQEMYKEVPLEQVQELLEGSYQEVRALIKRHTEAELFTKKHYPWTGSTSLGAYLISATSSHYDWALKLIKKCLR